MDYKKLIKSRAVRIKFLRMLEWIPDEVMLRIQYRIKFKKKLNLKHPKRYTEKLQWYKLNYRIPLMTQCVDKYEVHKYVASKGLSETLNEIYGVYNSPRDIDFDTLPDCFVLKSTNGGGGNNVIICKDKSRLDIKKAIDDMDDWLKLPRKNVGREWAYNNVKPMIIAEKYLANINPETGIDEGIEDYKFICFNGKVKYIWVDIDRQTAHKRNFYTIDWKFIDVSSEYPNYQGKIEKPEGISEMLEVANILCKDFPHVRVDLYYIDGKVYFGELTFYSSSGYADYTPDDFDYVLGDNFKLPEIKREK